LSGGETVQVTYRVKVKAYADQGDHELDNFVTVTGQQPPNTCVPGSDLCTEHPTKAPTSPAGHHAPGDPQGTDDTPQGPGGALAETGSPFVIVPAALIGLASLGLGSWLLIRRRRGVTG
jgi:LPXTG-motif cell wall-anchored protein